MPDFVLKISPNIIIGSHTAERLAQLVTGWGTKYMVLMDPVLKEYGISEKIQSYLKEGRVECFIYEDIPPAPDTRVLEQALKLARGARVHGIIAVGGTKAANIGRAIAALYNESNNMYDFIDGAQPCSGALPFICISTAMRDPFLFSDRSPVIDARNKQVKLLKVQNALTKLVLFDTNLSSSLTEKQRISLAMQMLCIALEAYISTNASFFSDTFTEKTFELVMQALDGTESLNITATPDLLLAQGGCLASLSAGISSLGAVSALAMILNAREKLSRSLITSILFPYLVEDIQHIKTEQVAFAARKINPGLTAAGSAEAAAALPENLRMRLAQSGLPSRLKELGLSLDKLAVAAQDASQLEFMRYSPHVMSADELFNMLKKAF